MRAPWARSELGRSFGPDEAAPACHGRWLSSGGSLYMAGGTRELNWGMWGRRDVDVLQGGGLCTPHQGVRLGDMVLKSAPLLMENDKYP